MTTVAVVTVVHRRHEHLARQQRSLALGSRRPDVRVVVAVDDDDVGALLGPDDVLVRRRTDPRGLPVAAARNAGVDEALRRGAESLVLLDVDCLAGRDLVAAYAAATVEEPLTLWSGPVTYLPPGAADDALAHPERHDAPHPARPAPAPGERVAAYDPALFWSLSFAVHRDGWETAGGFCEEYVGYGGEDTDFALDAVAHGLGLAWLGSARAYHQHHPTQDPPVQHLDDVLRNGRLFASRWGRWPMEGWLRGFADRGLVRREGEDWVRTGEGASR